MRRQILQTARTISLASLLATGSIAAAEPPATAPPEASAIEAASGQAWAAQVEMALLADPLTYPYAIKSQFSSAGLVLRGYVPNADVKARATTIAREAVSQDVIDRLTVHAAVLVPAQEQLPLPVGEARQRLRKVHATLGQALQITQGPNGRVTLAGTASSVEEKLEFSRCLRGLQGCQSIRNQIVVDSVAALEVAKSLPKRTLEPIQVASTATTDALPKTEAPLLPSPPTPPIQLAAAPSGPVESFAPEGQPALVTFDRMPPEFDATSKETPSKPKVEVPPPAVIPQPLKDAKEAAKPASSTGKLPLVSEEARTLLPPTPTELLEPPPPLSRPPLDRDVPAPTEPAIQPAARVATVKPQDSDVLVKPRDPRDLVQQRSQPPQTSSPRVPAYDTPDVPAPRVQTALRLKILQTVGLTAKDVLLTFDGRGGLEIVLHVRPDAEVGKAMAQVVKVAELSAYDVKVKLRRE